MLVLLIIFMVTAPLLVAGVPIDLPESRAGALDQKAKPVQIAIDGSGRITIDDSPVADAELPRALANIAAQPQPPEGRRIYLRADRNLDYGRVMKGAHRRYQCDYFTRYPRRSQRRRQIA